MPVRPDQPPKPPLGYPIALDSDSESAGLSFQAQRRLLYGLLAAGVFFRLFHFFNNRSFFIDELFLSVNIIKLNFGQLTTGPFEYQQKAPLGYLWTVRGLVGLFGRHEPALRLFSLLCGIGALGLFVPVARHFLRSWGAVLAVGVLALGYPAVYHSVEAKQYSAELLGTVVALYLYVRYQSATTLAPLLAWGLLGGLLLWFSFSAIFILAGIGVVIGLHALRRRDWRTLLLYLVPGGLWLLSFGLQYHFFIGKYQDSGWLADFFKVKYDAYLPLAQPAAAVQWLGLKGYDFLSHPLGVLLEVDDTRSYFGLRHVLKMGWLMVLLLIMGTYCLLRHDRQLLLLLLLPLGLALVASALSQFPFYQRFTLFLAPLTILLLAHGAQYGQRLFLRGQRGMVVLLALVLLPASLNSARQAINPDSFYNREYYRDVVLHVNEQYRPGDAVYVYWNMRQAYEYYQAAYGLKYGATQAGLTKNRSVSQADYLQNLEPDFKAFAGHKRLWFVYDVNNRDAIGDYVNRPAWYHDPAFPPGRLLNEKFASLGRRVAHYQRGNYAATLYELR